MEQNEGTDGRSDAGTERGLLVGAKRVRGGNTRTLGVQSVEEKGEGKDECTHHGKKMEEGRSR